MSEKNPNVEKAKEVWSATRYDSRGRMWWVTEEGTHSKNDHGPFTESQARAVAKALNAGEASRG